MGDFHYLLLSDVFDYNFNNSSQNQTMVQHFAEMTGQLSEMLIEINWIGNIFAKINYNIKQKCSSFLNIWFSPFFGLKIRWYTLFLSYREICFGLCNAIEK